MARLLLLPILASSTLALISAVHVLAHGHAEHGGAFDEVDEYTFELVGKRSQGDKVSFDLYIKDPSLSPVIKGETTLEVVEGEGRIASARLKPGSDKAFHGDLDLKRRGRYRATVLLRLPGKKPLRSHLSVKLP